MSLRSTEEVTEPIRINRSEVFNGYGALRPFSWLYEVIVPGQPWPMHGKGLGWARGIAKEYRADGQDVIETWRVAV